MARVKATILCIDDHWNGLIGRKMLLEQSGYEVLEATGWDDGLRLFRSRMVDAVVQAGGRARMDGFYRTQVTNRGTAFLNRFLGSKNCFIQDRRRIVGFPRQQFTRGLKLKRDPLKALK